MAIGCGSAKLEVKPGNSMHDPVTIYCPNYLCQAPNPESHKFCQQCRTLIPKRHLWIVGKGTESLGVGELLGDRYLVKHNRIVLDTQPGIMPESPEELPAGMEAYLKLSPYQLHIPQIYGLLYAPHRLTPSSVLLLEQAPIDSEENSLEATLMSALTEVWSQSSALRQLNWLWQIAHLWQPLSTEGVALTLLNPDLIRVEGSLVRLLELQFDRSTPSLSALGKFWQQLQLLAHPQIASYLKQLCQNLVQGQIKTAEQLIVLLDRALAICGQASTRQVNLATRTDKGPSRQRNEDACYPPGGTSTTVKLVGDRRTHSTSPPLVVVCDGIGGHEGGDVASNLAISTIQQRLPNLSAHLNPIDSIALSVELERAILAANDVINQRNDSEQRQERQRMGTTLVTALAQAHELYLAHVGDSRAYRITRTGCHQVTVDDDLAAREVRLGYSLYRVALQQPGSGSLVQALGMGASSLLHPTVQRFVIDEDCLFLLCSDGLSDYERVEQCWQTELLPVLEGKVDLVTASQRLVTIANTQNGHDNVTVGLIHCQVQSNAAAKSATPIDPTLANLDGSSNSNDTDSTPSTAVPPTAQTQVLRSPRSALSWMSTIVSLLLLLILGGLLSYLLIPEVKSRVDDLIGPEPDPSPIAASPETPISPNPPSLPLSVGSLIQVSQATVNKTGSSAPLVLLPQPGTPVSAPGVGSLPVGSVLQIVSRQALSNRGAWLKLKVCSLPVGATSNDQTVVPGQEGWVEQATIASLVAQNLGLTATQLGQCKPPTAATTTRDK